MREIIEQPVSRQVAQSCRHIVYDSFVSRSSGKFIDFAQDAVDQTFRHELAKAENLARLLAC